MQHLVQLAAGKRGWGPERLCKEWTIIQEAGEDEEEEDDEEEEEEEEVVARATYHSQGEKVP